MARRRKSATPRIAIAVTAIAVAIAMVGLWFGVQRMRSANAPVAGSVRVAADHVDPVNDGRTVIVAGKLEIGKPARDPELGISADAALLFRDVSMFQWREQCDGGACRYETAWLRQPVDSRKFRVAAGHENPPFPFADAHFAGEIRLGAFMVDPGLIATSAPAVAYPVHAAALPPNLAATFHEVNGILLTGSGGAPTVGEIHVGYRVVVPIATVSLTGVQHGAKLTAN